MLKIKKQNILINNAGAGFLISSTGVIYSTGAWGCSHQIYYSFSDSASLLRIHALLITISSSSRRSLKSLQCEEANSYILSMSTAPVISPLLMITRIFVPSLSTAKRSSSNSLYQRLAGRYDCRTKRSFGNGRCRRNHFEDIRRKSLQTASNTKANLDDRAGNGKAAGIKKDRSILAGA